MTDPLGDEFQLADPVIDLATGRAMVVVGIPEKTVAEWSGDNSYKLTENYANARLRADPNDPVYECAYVSSVQSEPNGPRGSDSGGYTFPSSRLARPTIESIEGIRRPYDAVTLDLLERLFREAMKYEDHDEAHEHRHAVEMLAKHALPNIDIVDEARELAHVEERFPEEDEDG